MKQDYYISLLYEDLKGSLSSAKKKELEDWLQKHEDHQKMASDIQAVWEQTSGPAPEPPSLPTTLDLDAEFGFLEDQLDDEPASDSAKVRPLRRSWPWMAAAAVIAVLLLIFFSDSLAPSPQWKEVRNMAENPLELPLPDGSRIWLNHASTLRYPESWKKDQRNIELSGEAYLEVAHDPDLPFSVQTPSATVRVLGTSFNVRDFPEDSLSEVFVRTGKVSFQASEMSQAVPLEVNEKILFNKRENTYLQEVDVTQEALSWYTQELTFVDVPLKIVINRLEQTFSISIDLQNPELDNCPFTSTLSIENATDALEVIGAVFGMEVTQTGEQTYSMKAGTCP